jgi:hypothetical protein
MAEWKDLLCWDKVGNICGIFLVIVGLFVVFSGFVPLSEIKTMVLRGLADLKFLSGLRIFGLGFAYLSFLSTRK